MQDGAYKLAQLIDVARLQRACDGVTAATGMTMAVLDTEGTILIASGWRDICTQFHRVNPGTAENCLESDRRINERLLAGMDAPAHISYQCANGLWDVAFPLLVDGQHVATVFTGQFFYDDDAVDVEGFRARARKMGFDEQDYLDALARVPMLTHEQVEQTISFLADLVGMLSESGLNALRDREAEAALQRSREILRAVLDTIPARVFWKDTDLRFLGANAPFANDVGLASPEDIVGKDDYSIAEPERARRYQAIDRVILESGEPRLLMEEPFGAGGGEPQTVLTSKVPLRDASGDVIGVLGTYMDVTERARAQREAEETRELLQYIVQHDPSAVAMLDNDLRYVFVSQRFLDDYRIEDRDVIGKTHYEVFPEIPERWREIHRRVLAGAVESCEEDCFPRADGTVDWVRWECRPWRRGDGAVGGMVLYSEIITERREAAEALRQSRLQYETFVNATDDIAFLKDDQLRYIMVNAANARFFEREPGDIIGRTDADLMPREAAAECDASDMRAIKLGGLVVTTERVGDRVYESRKFPVELADGRLGVGGFVRDVTEQRRAEGEIRRLATELERRVEQRTAQLAATNRELESFAYSISHDLRAPLRALDGFSEILLQDYGAEIDETGRGYLRRIKGAANHMAELMDGLLQLSRLSREELLLEDVDLAEMARSVVTDLQEQDPDRTVDVLVEGGLRAEADPKMLRVVLVNLLGNSWKFTSRHETARIEVGMKRRDGAPAFFVRDDGAGFDPRYARNLFGAFQRLHTPDQFEGTGIGLATVQRIVHRHGGAVWAEGEVEKGATFWFTLGASGGD